METLTGFLIVCVGAGIGRMLRHGITLAALRLFGAGFPYGTLAVNVVGSAVMGLVVGVFAAVTSKARISGCLSPQGFWAASPPSRASRWTP